MALSLLLFYPPIILSFAPTALFRWSLFSDEITPPFGSDIIRKESYFDPCLFLGFCESAQKIFDKKAKKTEIKLDMVAGTAPNVSDSSKSVIDPHMLYGTNIAQILLGLVISIYNSLLLAAVFSKQHLKTTTNILLGNICFANLVVGIMLCVVNVMDGWTQIALLKTETSLVIINCYINIASFLALITSKYVVIRSPTYKMTSGSCVRIILVMWIVVLLLLLVKALVFGFSEMGYVHSCFRCYQVFEVVTLVIFTVSTVAGYVVTGCSAATHRRQSVHDTNQPTAINYGEEFDMIMGLGLFLLIFVSCFIFFVIMYMTWLGSGNVVRGADEILVTIYFAHCIINPILICYIDRQIGRVVLRIVRCGGSGGDDGGGHQDPAAPVNERNTNWAARLNQPNGYRIPGVQNPEPSAPPESGRNNVGNNLNPASHPTYGSQSSSGHAAYSENGAMQSGQLERGNGPEPLAVEKLAYVPTTNTNGFHAPQDDQNSHNSSDRNRSYQQDTIKTGQALNGDNGASSLPPIERGRSALIRSGVYIGEVAPDNTADTLTA